ncbi:MAG: FKBP-type peptidyl-prolyl cis-trans isomerase [Prevotella sp.]|nr:FKBP-type peptidyl-prolyl cis-trans isomerase [Prevotella sp.]
MRKEKTIAIFVALLSLCMFSCSEEDSNEGEFDNWKERNETYFNNLYNKAKGSTSGTWRTYTSWSKEESAATAPDDHIVVEVLKEGTGTECPLYSDEVTIHYRGNLMPSDNFPLGYQFDSSWYGEYNLDAMMPVEMTVSGTVDGFITALQKMHVGDRWRVYIPYALGYKNSTSNAAIPAYSTLVFDITLVSFKNK